MSLDLLALSEYLRRLPREEARQVCNDLCLAANETLRQQHSSLELDEKYNGTEIARICERAVVAPNLASDPWQAYQYANMPREEVLFHLSSGNVKVLATIPTEYTYSSAIPDNFVAPYADSLVSYVADLIDGAQEELVIVMPYWSILGVDVIKGRVSGKSKSGLSITLMTPRPEEMKADDCQGVAAFRQFMAQAGATVEQLAPNVLSSGIRPLVHGKVVVADQKVAYLGSANLSKNGLNQSIEAGVALSGSEAMRLRNWFMSLTVHFHEVA